MEIVTTDDGTVARVVLTGKLDIAGAETISTPFATLSEARRGLIVDMSGVTFMSSIGIRHLVMAAKALSQRGGRLVLLRPTTMVAEVLTTTGVTGILPIVETDAAAEAMVR